MCELGLNRHQFCHEGIALQASAPAIVSTENQRSALSTVRSLAGTALWSPRGNASALARCLLEVLPSRLRVPRSGAMPGGVLPLLEQIDGAFPGAVLLP